MKPSDRNLGMDRAITRRDFLGGTALAVAGSLAPGDLLAGPAGALTSQGPAAVAYPPGRAGLRGSHPGAFEVAHQLALQGRRDWGAAREPDTEPYDLIIVGGGVSGLSAAHFFRRTHGADARILILENHDDFGGHAKRNEFQVGGRTILGYGGSQSMENPGDYSDVALGLLADLGVDLDKFHQAYDQEFYRNHGLAMGLFFDRATYGVDRLVRADLADASAFIPIARSGVRVEDVIDQMPLSEAARKDLLRLYTHSEDVLPDHSILSEPSFLLGISYRDFLVKHLKVSQPEVLHLLQEIPSNYFGVGIDGVDALQALGFGLPGLGATSLGRIRWLLEKALGLLFEPYIFHFPDGNASIARLLVRKLIPEVASGTTMEDIVTTRFDYSRLDATDSPVRLRLRSTVVNVQHAGAPDSASHVEVTYIRDGVTHRVRGKQCILACYNRVIPHLCPELPSEQKEALASLVKVPLVYTNVVLKDWHAWKKLGLGMAHCPGTYHTFLMLDFPVDLGEYRFARGPEDPIVLHMNRVPRNTSLGTSPQDQHRAGRWELLGTSFESIERDIRQHLAGMLSEAGFDPTTGIEAITVNRWPHGYAYTTNPLFDPEEHEPWLRGRRRHGRIAIANSDSGGRAYLDCAIDEAHRAVQELNNA